MTIWELLSRVGERAWFAFAMFVQTTFLIVLLALDSALRADDFFRQIALLIIGTGWMGFIVQMQDRGAKDRERADESQALLRSAIRTLTAILGQSRGVEPAFNPDESG